MGIDTSGHNIASARQAVTKFKTNMLLWRKRNEVKQLREKVDQQDRHIEILIKESTRLALEAGVLGVSNRELRLELEHFVACHVEGEHIDHHDVTRAKAAIAKARGNECGE